MSNIVELCEILQMNNIDVRTFIIFIKLLLDNAED